MATVSEKVLSWLYSVLHEYHDPQRTYSDIARTISTYPHFSLQTTVYTYDNGADALLVMLKGTLPAAFRGTVYHFPLKLHVPHAYPHEAPIVYIDPAKEMAVRPGQHVGVDGRIYHPYLRDWTSLWDRVNLTELLHCLQQVFRKEPPVIGRTQQQQFHRLRAPSQQQEQQVPGASQQPPQLPPKHHSSIEASTEAPNFNSPPPVPPKPSEEHAELTRNLSRDGPPLPPLPHELVQNQGRAMSLTSQNDFWQASTPPLRSFIASAQENHSGRFAGPSSVPPIPHQPVPQYQPPGSNHDGSPVSPVSPVPVYVELKETKYARPAPLPYQQPLQQNLQHPQHAPQYVPQQHSNQQQFHQGQPRPLQPNQLPYQQTADHSVRQNRQPAPDLLSDPFDFSLSVSSGSEISAPPIPPNPEREHLLQAISSTLVQQAQQRVNQNLEAIAPLQAQHSSLRTAYEHLDGEIRQLEQLEQALSSNEAILHRSIHDCDRTIALARSKKQPSVDEVLIAPTMVASQLWTLCAEEAACRQAMYVLQKAVDRGRVSGNDFVRQMRSLGRESFMKMALARKCAKGMGLELSR